MLRAKAIRLHGRSEQTACECTLACENRLVAIDVATFVGTDRFFCAQGRFGRLLQWEALIQAYLKVTSNQCTADQAPTISDDKEGKFERQRDDDGRHHHHTHGHQDRGDDQIDDQEWQKY